MARHLDERTEVAQFKPEYFQWLQNQDFSIQDFPYAGVDFRGDPNMALPPREQWDDSGKIIFNIFLIKIFCFCFYLVPKLIVKVSNADVGPQRPAALRPYERKQPAAVAPAPQDESTETLAELESHLERLTRDIPETNIMTFLVDYSAM